MRRLALVLSLAAVAGLAAASKRRNAVPSARLTLVRELTTDLVMAVTNRRTVPLELIAIQYRAIKALPAVSGIGPASQIRDCSRHTGELRLEDMGGRSIPRALRKSSC